MAVEIKYIVVREGQEKMAFANKKDADAYDKMLDLAEVFSQWFTQCPLQLDESQTETMTLWLAENRDTLATILKSGKLPSIDDTQVSVPQLASSTQEENTAPAPGKNRQVA